MSTSATVMLVIVLGIFAATLGLLIHTVNKPQAEDE